MSALTIPIHYFYWTLSSSYPPKPSNQSYWNTTTNTYNLTLCRWYSTIYTSTQEIIKTIQSFSKISDHAINWNKSSILPLHKTKWDVAPHQSPIPICHDHITYLGIKISSKLSELVKLNFTPLLKK